MSICKPCEGTGKVTQGRLKYSIYDERRGVEYYQNTCWWCGGSGKLDDKDDFTQEFKFSVQPQSILKGVFE